VGAGIAGAADTSAGATGTLADAPGAGGMACVGAADDASPADGDVIVEKGGAASAVGGASGAVALCAAAGGAESSASDATRSGATRARARGRRQAMGREGSAIPHDAARAGPRVLVPCRPMTLDDLSKEEQLALGGLIRLMLRSDGDFSEAEEAQVNALGAELADPGRLWSVVSASAQAHRSDADIRAAAGRVTRPEVRALLRDALTRIARVGEMTREEQSLLDWLASLWGG
jgi:hypothetical protein